MNERIRVPEVRLIGDDGEQIGVIQTDLARERARESGLDLVEVAPNARPPVCRLMDYGKFKYEQRKKQQKAREKQHRIRIKGIRLRPKTDDHDFQVKVRQARSFLEEGNKVQVTLLFRGREMSHMDLGRDVLMRFAAELADLSSVERAPKLEGRRMTLLLNRNA
ncbi:MAG: translation initiation factor IF-3 [Planctomycetes bacterium]|nr:translation initiation factor IF-3 [Planctomycetota bacterium]